MDTDKELDGVAPVIVAITASAVGFPSLETLLKLLPPGDDAALVLVLQHREALDEDRFWRAVESGGHVRAEVEDGAVIAPNLLYLAPPGMIVTVGDGRFHTRPIDQDPGISGGASPDTSGLIDSFLVSLAGDTAGRCIVAALAGTEGDGTLGVQAIKEAGGLALAERQEEELARSESPAAIADAVLGVEELAPRIAALVEQIAQAMIEGPSAQEDAGEAREARATIAAILRTRTGHDFHGYKSGTFLRRVHRRMQALLVTDMAAYVETLRISPDEAQSLFNDLLIGVTEFFRDRREWEILEREVVPRLFEGKGPGDSVRVWVSGCATGEEAYSIAILLAEHRARIEDPPQVQIFASDLDGRALALARSGRYAEAIIGQIAPERLGRWFVREGDTFCVSKALREMCIFSQHSLIKDPPFSRLDLVSCRNLLIYLDADLQERVVPLFHFALRPDGFLFLGNSENVSRHAALFAPVEPRSRIFRKLKADSRGLISFPLASVDRRPPSQAGQLALAEPPGRDAGDLTRWAERVVERHSPAYVIIDEALTVLHFSGNMGQYLAPSRGAASLNLLQLVHPGLRTELRAALDRARMEARGVEVDGLEIGTGSQRLAISLVVEPRRKERDAPQGFAILFKDQAAQPEAVTPDASRPGVDLGEHLRRLEEELRVSRDRLQSTIEELESTNEELKSSNEEYQSLNEELQSANEELETSKEELQSMNEELTTVNGELGHRVAELARANSDLKNFLESTQIATLFLDNDLRVTTFTPASAELFHLIESDHGRPIGHIKARIVYDELPDDARRVLRTLAPVEREVGDPRTGALYMVRVLPYRSIDNFIAGVVVTFTDVTARRESEARQAFLLRLNDDVRAQPDEAAIGILATRRLAEHLRLDRCYLAVLFQDEDRVEVGPEFRRPDLAPASGTYRLSVFPEVVRQVQTRTVVIDDVAGDAALTESDRAALGAIDIGAFVTAGVRRGRERVLWALVVMSTVRREWTPGEVALVEDVAERTWAAVERARAEGALRDSEVRYRTLFETMGQGYCDLQLLRDASGRAVDQLYLELNPAYERLIGVPVAQAKGRKASEVMPDLEPWWTETFDRIAERGEPEVIEHPVASLGRWFEVSSYPRGGDRLTVLYEDITERKRGEAAMRKSQERQGLLLQLSDVLRILSDPREIQDRAMRLLGEALGVARVYHFDVEREPDGWVHLVEAAFQRDADAPSMIGRHSLSRFGGQMFEGFARGEVVAAADVALLGTLSPAELASYRALGVTAFINVPLMRDGEYNAGIGAHHVEPHEWTDHEVTLIREVAARTWAAVERARAEAALRESEEQLQGFGEASSDVVWIRDAGTLDWTYLSPAFEHVYGLSREEALTGDTFRNWLELVVPEDREHARAMIMRAVAGERVTFEYHVRRPVDGTVRTLRNTDFPIRDADGRVTFIGGVGHDATEEKAAQAAIERGEQRLRSLMEGIPQLVWTAGEHGSWTWASPQWTAFTGQAKAESHGWGWLETVHPDDREGAREAWERSKTTGTFEAEYRLREAATGEHRWFRSRAAPVRDEAGRIVEWLGTSTDVQDLREMQERQGVLVAELQHRTRNLMGVVRSVGEQTLRSSEDLTDFAPRFRDRMAALTRANNLLSRLDEGQRVAFDELIGAEVAALGDAAREPGRVTLSGPKGVALRSTGVQTFALALHELATNALKYGALAEAQPDGRLAVTWRVAREEGGPWLYVDWHETGVAMPRPGVAANPELGPELGPESGTASRGGGAGRQLIERALPYQLGARTSFVLEPDGVRCTIALPVSDRTTA